MARVSVLTRIAGAAAAVSVMAGAAHAGGTNAGTSVENTFTLDYEVGNTAQPTITNDTDTTIPGATVQGSETVFTVDRLVDLTLTQLNSPLTVAPNSSGNRQIFRLTNLGNDNQAYDLSSAFPGGNDYAPTGVSLQYFIDLDGDDTFDSGTETLLSYTPGTATTDIAPDQRVIIFMDSDVPVSAADGDTASIVLTADTLNPTTSVEPGFSGTAGAPVAGDTDGNDLVNDAENVLADGAGSTDAANQGDFSATAVQNVEAANLTASKTVVVLEDQPADDAACVALTAPAAGDQFSVPGACIQYVIDVENTGSGDATTLVIFDRMPAEVTFLSASLTTTSATGFDDDPNVAGTGPTLTAPASAENCNGTSNCSVQLDNAVLAAGENGQIRIWAKVD